MMAPHLAGLKVRAHAFFPLSVPPIAARLAQEIMQRQPTLVQLIHLPHPITSAIVIAHPSTINATG